MYSFLIVMLVVVALLIILSVVMQPAKSNAASMLSGSDDGQPKMKARGFEAFLIKSTTVLGILFFAITLALAYLSAQ